MNGSTVVIAAEERTRERKEKGLGYEKEWDLLRSISIFIGVSYNRWGISCR